MFGTATPITNGRLNAIASRADARGAEPPPHSLDAERSVLGGILLDNTVLALVTPLISDADFYSPANRLIFSAMCGLAEASTPIDTTTLRAELATRLQLAHAGGDEYVLGLSNTIPTVANIEAHAEIIRSRSVVRRLLETLSSAQRSIMRSDTEATRKLLGDVAALGALVDAKNTDTSRLGRRTALELSRLPPPDPNGLCLLGSVPLCPGAATLLYGAKASLKTMLALDAGVRVAHDGHRVLVLEAEGPDQAIGARCERLAVGHGYDWSEVGSRIDVLRGFELLANLSEWRTEIDQQKPALVIVDPFASYASGDENSADQVNAVLRELRYAADKGAALLLLHHTGKAGTAGGPRGSSAFGGWFDSLIACERAPLPLKDITLTYEKEKERDEPPPDHWRFTLGESAYTLERLGAQALSVETPSDDKTARVIELLRQAPRTRVFLREHTNLKLSGSKVNEVLKPLIDAGLVVEKKTKATDKRGYSRDVDTLHLVTAGRERMSTDASGTLFVTEERQDS